LGITLQAEQLLHFERIHEQQYTSASGNLTVGKPSREHIRVENIRVFIPDIPLASFLGTMAVQNSMGQSVPFSHDFFFVIYFVSLIYLWATPPPH